MSQRLLIQRETAAWTLQVRVSFALALAACAGGIWSVSGQDLERIFLAVGFFFCLFTGFTLAKLLRDNQSERIDTTAWTAMVWIGFLVAMALTAWGLFRMTVGNWEKGFFVVSWLYLISSAFTLSKSVRDRQDADLLEAAGGSEPPAGGTRA